MHPAYHQESPPDRDFELSWTPVVKGAAIALFHEPTDQGVHVLVDAHAAP